VGVPRSRGLRRQSWPQSQNQSPDRQEQEITQAVSSLLGEEVSSRESQGGEAPSQAKPDLVEKNGDFDPDHDTAPQSASGLPEKQEMALASRQIYQGTVPPKAPASKASTPPCQEQHGSESDSPPALSPPLLQTTRLMEVSPQVPEPQPSGSLDPEQVNAGKAAPATPKTHQITQEDGNLTRIVSKYYPENQNLDSRPLTSADIATNASGYNTQQSFYPSVNKDPESWPIKITISQIPAEKTMPDKVGTDISVTPHSESDWESSENQDPGQPNWEPVKPKLVRITDPKLDWLDRIGSIGTEAGKITIGKFFSQDITMRSGAMSLQENFRTTGTVSKTKNSELTFLGAGFLSQRLISSDIFERDKFNDSAFGNDVFVNPRSQLIVFNFKQKLDDFSFGGGYRSFGADINKLDDIKKMVTTNIKPTSCQQVAEFWMANKFGPLTLKPFIGRFWDNKLFDNVKDSKRYRMATNVAGITLDNKVPLLPLYFGGSYSQENSNSIFIPKGKEPRSTFNKNLGGYLYFYCGKFFDLTASTSYSHIQDKINEDNITQVYWHEISANFRPTWYITITPIIALGDYRWPGNKTKTQLASLSLNYSKIFRNVDLWFWGSWSQTKGTAGYEDYKNLNAYLGISWQPISLSQYNAKFSLEGGYNKYIDNIYPEYTEKGFISFMSFKMKF
jgi:hypothetical protein